MKINKILSLVLALAVSATMLSVPTVSMAETVDADRVIYEDNFDKYTGFSGTLHNLPVRENVFKESSEFKSENKYSKYAILTDENDPKNKFIQLDSPYNSSFKQYYPTNIEYLPDEAILTKENQMEKGNLKLSFSFRVDDMTENGGATGLFKVLSAESLDSTLDDYKLTMFGLGALYQNGKLKAAIQTASADYDRTHLLDSGEWYDVVLIYDLIGNNLNTNVAKKSDGTVIKNFDHKLNWCGPFGAATPEEAREYEAIRNVLFRTDKGLTVSIDDFKLEYYLADPEISPKDIAITDYRGVVVENTDAVSPAVVSINLPFGTTMSEESTNTETVVLKDSKGNEVAYIPEYSHNAYTLKIVNCLDVNETYKLYIPETVENIFGASLGREVIYSFTTTNKKPEFMAIESVKIGETEIAELSNIVNGETIDVYIEYANNSDEEISSYVSVSYYSDDMLVYTESAVGETVSAGEMGAETISFIVPSSNIVNLDEVDRVSVCLWEGFENSIAYVASFEIGNVTDEEFEVTTKAPAVTYSYGESALNIQGIADKGSKYVTVQILMPGSSFEDGTDEDVFYRGQAPVVNGMYSVDIRFDEKQNLDSTLESGVYPARIFVDDIKLDIDEVYINAYPDFVADCKALSDAANDNDFEEFKRIINEERQSLNFEVGFAKGDTLDDELEAYFDYVKGNSLNVSNEIANVQAFKTYVAIEYLNGNKLSDIEKYMNELLVDKSVKTLCSEMIYDDEVGAYFGKLVSGKNIKGVDKFEEKIKEGLILTTAKYGNGYGDLKKVLENCGDAVGISTPVSTAACKALMGNTYQSGSAFKDAYDKNTSTSSGGGGGGGGGSSSGGGSKNETTSAVIKLETVEKAELVPVAKEFNDIDNYEWATESILGLADMGIINGVSENKFAPSRNVTREEFAKIIVGALKMTEYEYGANIFADAASGEWFTPYINIAADLGVANGIGGGRFGVGLNISRQDMAVMIYNALLYRGVNMVSGELHFADSNEIAEYAKTAVSALYNMGAVNGVSETSFAPNSYATRAEAAKMVYRVLGQLQG